MILFGNRQFGWFLCFLLAGSVLLGCGKKPDQTLYLAAYTTPREAFRKINQAFEKDWKARTGQSIKIKESYLSSGAQSRAVVDGFEADVVALALGVDVDRIQEAGLITGSWRQGPSLGILTRSVVAFAVRPGNPHGIRSWDDLLKPGLKVLTPNPKTSGGAQWNVLAAYGAALRGKVNGFPPNGKGAGDYLTRLLGQVTAMDKGARESILTFERGLGDVALSYENEILLGQAHGNKYELIIPNSTILIENPVALVDKNISAHGNGELALQYLVYLYSSKAQKIFAKHGFRPVNAEAMKTMGSQFSPIQDLFTVGDFGGWKKVMKDFFGPKGIFQDAAEEAQTKKIKQDES